MTIARSIRPCLLLAAALLVGSPDGRASVMPRYTITDLGALPGQSQSIATGINDLGQVVGFSYTTRYDGTFVGPWSEGGRRYYLNQSYDAGVRSFQYDGAGLREIAPTDGLANSINNAGQVVGGSSQSINDSGQYIRGAGMSLNGNYSSSVELVTNGVAVALNNGSPPFFRPVAINSQGRVSGFADVGVGQGFRAAFYDDGQVQLYPDWGGSRDVRAIDLNDIGETIFNVKTNNSYHVDSILYRGTDEGRALWTNLTTLSDGDFVALAMNDLSQVVGTGYLYDSGELLRLADLIEPQAGWSQLDGVDINDLGQIVGQGVIDGQRRAFLMTPASVPEPTPLALAGLVMIWAAWCRNRASAASKRGR